MLAREIPLMLLVYGAAALFEIAGSFALWAVLRLGKPVWWIAPGIVALLLFAFLLTRIDVAAAGRAYAAYGGIYIASSLAWLWLIEGIGPTRWDLTGASLSVAGALIILLGRGSAS